MSTDPVSSVSSPDPAPAGLERGFFAAAPGCILLVDPDTGTIREANAACAGHGVCVSVCPTGALQGYTDGQGRGLRFDPAACTACHLCTRLCPEQALRLASTADQDTTAAQPRRLTRHQTRRCDECGAEHLAADVLCPACRADQDFARSAFHTFLGRRAA